MACLPQCLAAPRGRTWRGDTVEKRANWSAHWFTLVWLGHRTIVERPMVHAAEMPTRVLPAPHGSTMTPERARPLPNILLRSRRRV